MILCDLAKTSALLSLARYEICKTILLFIQFGFPGVVLKKDDQS